MEMFTESRILLSKYKRNSNVQLPKTIKQAALEQRQAKTVFFDSEDQYIKKNLVNQGWTMTNVEKNCSLKWTYNIKHNTFSELSKNTKINHFPHSHMLTTKLGLCKTLKGQREALINEAGRAHSQYYPRSYDLSEENEDFIKDFNQTAVINLLKKIMISFEMENEQLFQQLHRQTALLDINKKQRNWISEVDLLCKENQIFEKSKSKNRYFTINGKIFEEILYYFSLMLTLDSDLNESNIDENSVNRLVAYSQLDPPYRSLEDHYEGNKALAKYPTIQALKIFFGLYRDVMLRFRWFRIDGLRNVWVVKANDSSRGRSIILVSSLEELKLLNSGTRLIQKYVEDVWIYRTLSLQAEKEYPFLSKLNNKKFDIRIWVLVKSFSPLQVFIYQEGYLRISQEDYQLIYLDRNCTHLTNFSVNWKDSQINPQNSYVLLSEFTNYLDQQGIKSKQELMKQIHTIILQTLQTADLALTTSDPRCFQLFGFDILIDSELNPWLLEINMSPACKQRGRLALELEKMGAGLLSLVGLTDYNPHATRWIPLTNQSHLPKKAILKKQNTLPFTKSQSFFHQMFSNGCSFRHDEEEQISLSRTKSILPSISSNQQSHCKLENLNSYGGSSNLMVTGKKLAGKTLKQYDKFINSLDAAITISKYYRKFAKNKKDNYSFKKKNTTLIAKTQSFRFLRLLECLIVLSKKSQLRGFKKLKKLCCKKSFKVSHFKSL